MLARFRRVRAEEPWKYSWQSHWKPGRRLEGQPRPYVYALPYRDGPRRVSQAAHGTFSHGEGSQNEEAIDWAMPEGTRVYPARAGTVVGLRSDVTEGGAEERFKKVPGNFVLIFHDDGTFAEYRHLQPRGVLVRLGDKVGTDQAIGLSGSTGYSSIPHLHFAVFNPVDGMTRRTWPVRFAGANGTPISLEKGKSY